MKTQLKNAVMTGVVFAIVMIFLTLVAFHVTIADLLATLLRYKPKDGIFGLTFQMFYMLVFFGLIGLWAGARGVGRDRSLSMFQGLVNGAVAGFVLGLNMAVLGFIIGTLNAAKVKMSTYLAQMVPGAINQFLMGRNPTQLAALYLVFFTLAGILGASLVYLLRYGNIRMRLASAWNGAGQAVMGLPPVRAIQANRFSRYFVYSLLLIGVFLLPQRLGQYWNYTLGTIGIYVLLGLGLNIVVGLAGLLDLGYVAFFAIGAYAVALLTAPQPHQLEWSFWLALPIGVVLASLAGVLLGIPVLRLRGDYLAIVTLGFGEIIRILSKSDLLNDFSGGPKGVKNIAGPTLLGQPFSSDIDFVYLILLAVLLVIFVTNRLKNSRVGRAWIAMREDETVAQANGINTLQMKLLAFAIGAAFAGLGGVLFASRNQFTGPEDHSFMVSINVLCVVIVGGMGSIPGVIAGAFVLKGLPEVLRQLENFRIVAFGALLVIMMIIRPEGLIPSNRRRLEMHQEEIPPGSEIVSPAISAGAPGAAEITLSTPEGRES